MFTRATILKRPLLGTSALMLAGSLAPALAQDNAHGSDVAVATPHP